MGKIHGKVKAVSGPREHEGVLQIGFILAEDPDKWYNIAGEEGILKEYVEKTIKKGSEIEFDQDANKNITNLKLIKEAEKTGKWEDDMVTFETLLTKAHDLKKPFSIKTEMLVVDLEKKYALFKATVVVHTETGSDIEFDGHGDATIENVTGEFIKPHFIRMAETRAIVRALRWYTNNGVAEEEKGGESGKASKK